MIVLAAPVAEVAVPERWTAITCAGIVMSGLGH
ncbi:hypothetical protein MGAST_04335 [Mycobacterium gastri 'Wayne']|nr:hypothetical protein MGAST_04335 [Mycobacterium gastri 'Wayne']